MSEKCYMLRLSDDPADVATVRLDISDGEPTDDDLAALCGYLVAVRNLAEGAGGEMS